MGNVLTLVLGEQALVPASTIFTETNEVNSLQRLTLTGNLTLTNTSPHSNYFDPDGLQPLVTLPSAAGNAGRIFFFRNIGTGGAADFFDITDGGPITVRVRPTGNPRRFFESDGVNWYEGFRR